MDTNAKDRIEYYSIRMTRNKIMQMEGNYPATIIKNEEIVKITIKEDIPTTKPKFQIFLGIMTILVGLLPLLWLIRISLYGGRINIYMFLWFVWIYVGGWMIYKAVTKEIFLEVETSDKKVRLFLEGNIIPQELVSFIKIAKGIYGDKFQSDIWYLKFDDARNSG
jgi:hypothetical protein